MTLPTASLLKTPFFRMINISFKRQENVLGGKRISWNCPYHFIYKYIGYMLDYLLSISSHICPQRTIKAMVTSFMCKETLMWIKSRRRKKKKKDGGHLQNSSRNLNLLVLTHSVSRYIFPWDKISETQKAISWYFYNEFLFWKSGNIMMRLNLPSLYFIWYYYYHFVDWI